MSHPESDTQVLTYIVKLLSVSKELPEDPTGKLSTKAISVLEITTKSEEVHEKSPSNLILTNEAHYQAA